MINGCRSPGRWGRGVLGIVAGRAASGFAHGRYGRNRRASQPRAALPADDNGVHTLALVIDEDQHQPLAHYCDTMLNRLQGTYHARAATR